MREVERHLEAQWFAVVVAGPDGEVEFRDEQDRRKRNRHGVREDRWTRESIKTIEYELQVQCNMPYTRTRDEL